MKKLAALIILIMAIAMALHALCVPSNCGGNSFALSMCRQVGMSAKMYLLEYSDATMNDLLYGDPHMFSLSQFQRWGAEDFWVYSPNRQIKSCEGPIIICRDKFNNVPQPTLWNLYGENPAHAASNINGDAFLLSVDEYEKIDKEEYVLVSHLLSGSNKLIQGTPLRGAP